MKNLTLSLLTLTLLACGNSVTPPESAREEEGVSPAQNPKLAAVLGFYALNDPKVPSRIRETAPSVFDIRVLALGEDSLMETTDVTESQGQAVREKIKALDPSQYDAQAKTVLLKQVEKCEAQQSLEQKKKCQLIYDIRQATGFLAGDGSTLWTNAHVIDPFLTMVEKLYRTPKLEQLAQQNRLAVYIFDQQGELVLDPHLETVHVEQYPQETAFAKKRGMFYAQDSDYVSLKLAKSIGKPLKIAQQRLNAGDGVYLLGYPQCTGCTKPGREDDVDFKDRTPYPNSDGKGLKVTLGHVLEKKGLPSFFDITVELFARYELEHIYFASADSQHGSSGSPVLNERGEVVAIHTGGLSKSKDGTFERVSRSVIPKPWLKKN